MTMYRGSAGPRRLASRRCGGLLAILGFVVMLVGPSTAMASAEWSNPTLLDPWWGVSAVSCASASDCVGVGSNSLGGSGLAASYNGTSWSMGAVVNGTSRLESVSCPSAARCVAVGGTDAVVDNAGNWEAPEVVDGGGHLVSVSCGSETFCVATDEEGYALIYKTGKWATREDVDGTAVLQSVSCAGEFCAAVDGSGNALIYTGGKWSTPESIDGSHALHTVSCLSTNFCIAVDNDGNALTYGAGKWSTPTSIDGTTPLISVSCTTESRCVAGTEGQGTFVDSSGTWTLGTTITGWTSCVPASTFCAVTDGTGYTTNYSGGAWSTPEDFGGEFGNVSCASSSYCVATDEAGHVLVSTGGKWSGREAVFPGGDRARPVSCISASFCAAANGEQIVQFNGTTWTTVSLTSDPSRLISISCASEALCVAGDTNGNYLVDHGGAWSSTPASSDDGGHPLEAISCSTDTFCMAVNELGETLIYNGSSWGALEPTHVALFLGNGQDQLSCAPGTHFCAAAAEAGKAMMTYSNGSWGAPVSISSADGWNLVSCTSESFCLAESYNGRITSTYNGTAWGTPQKLPGTEDGGPWALSCGTPTICVLLEEDGHALTYTNAAAGVPENTEAPTIAGTPTEGQTLTESHGEWSNNPTSYTYQWEHCDSTGSDCQAVTGATHQTYELTANDVGSRIRVQETAKNAEGAGAPEVSAATNVVHPSIAGISLTPAFSNNNLGEGATFSTALLLTGTEYHATVAPLRQLTIHLPSGIGGTQSGFPTCTQTTLEMLGPTGCPSGSMAGPVGSISFADEIGGELIEETGTLQAIFAPDGGLLFYAEAHAPFSVEITASATIAQGTAPYGRSIAIEFPLIEVVPGAPFASVTAITLNLGTSRQEGPTTINSVIVPEQCPQSGEFPWAADLTLYEHTPQQATAETACPDSSGKHGTTTILQVSEASPEAGESTTYTAVVLPQLTREHIPSGTVAFLDEGTPVAGCSAQPLTQGSESSTATCQISYAEAGEHHITAAYAGDTNFFGSSSPTHTVTIRSASTNNSGGDGGGSNGSSSSNSNGSGSSTGGATGTSSSSTGESTTTGPTGTTHSIKPLTQAQKLAKALKSCKKLKKSKRKTCEAQAKKRYEPKKKTKKKKG